MQHEREVRQRIRRARLALERRVDEAISLAGLAALVVQHAEQMQRVKIIALRLQHARVEARCLVEAALLMQRDRLLDGLAGVERTWLGRTWRPCHSRLVPAMRRVTSAGVAWSAAVLIGSGARAAGPLRQRLKHAFMVLT